MVDQSLINFLSSIFYVTTTNSHKNGNDRGILFNKIVKNPNGTWTQKRVNLKGERGGRSFRKENATIRA